jgi:hypothetical protein
LRWIIVCLIAILPGRVWADPLAQSFRGSSRMIEQSITRNLEEERRTQERRANRCADGRCVSVGAKPAGPGANGAAPAMEAPPPKPPQETPAGRR